MADASLAVIWLATQLFVSVIQVCQFISTAQGLAFDAPILYWRFRTEEARLRAFGRYWGLRGSLSEQFNEQEELQDVVCGILRQMQNLFEDPDNVAKKYDFCRLSVEDSHSHLPTSKPTSPSAFRPR
jgi:hypothetical protein